MGALIIIVVILLLPVLWFVVQYNSLVGLRNYIAEAWSNVDTELKRRGDLLLLAPIVRNRKGFHTDIAEWAAKHGYQEIRADGKIFATGKSFRLDRFKEHDVEIVVRPHRAKTYAAALHVS